MGSLFNVPSTVLGVGVGTRAWTSAGHPPARPNAWCVQQSRWGQSLACRANPLLASGGARQ